MSWVWVDGRPVWMGDGPEEEDVIMTVEEHLEYERHYRHDRRRALGGTAIPYSRRKGKGAEHLRG